MIKTKKVIKTYEISLTMDELIRLELIDNENKSYEYYLPIDVYDMLRHDLNWFNEKFIEPLDEECPCIRCKYEFDEKNNEDKNKPKSSFFSPEQEIKDYLKEMSKKEENKNVHKNRT